MLPKSNSDIQWKHISFKVSSTGRSDGAHCARQKGSWKDEKYLSPPCCTQSAIDWAQAHFSSLERHPLFKAALKFLEESHSSRFALLPIYCPDQHRVTTQFRTQVKLALWNNLYDNSSMLNSYVRIQVAIMQGIGEGGRERKERAGEKNITHLYFCFRQRVPWVWCNYLHRILLPTAVTKKPLKFGTSALTTIFHHRLINIKFLINSGRNKS